MTATRRQAREWAVQMLTAADLNPGDSSEQVISNFWTQLKTLADDEGGADGEVPHGKLKLFAEERVKGVLDNLGRIDEELSQLLSEEWTVDRLGTVERAVLRLGVWELENTDIPKAVVINEAIDLANWFSTPKSRTIVNGVLDRLAKSVRPAKPR